ncbi:MAG: cache domain-containing protein [Candidatus Brocadiales bacterium]
MEKKHTDAGHRHEPGHPGVHGAAVRGVERKSLYRYLIFFCLFASVLPFLATSLATYIITRGVIRQKEFNQLVSIRDIKKKEVVDYFFERRADAFQLSSNGVFKSVARSYIEAFHKGGLNGSAYEDVDRKHGDIIISFAEAYQYFNVMILDMHGDVVASARDRPELGENVLKAPYAGTPIEKAFIAGKTGIDITDMKWYGPGNHLAMFISAPMTKDFTESPIAVVVFHLDNRKINDIMTQRSGLKETGETYLVGEDFLLRSDSRFAKDRSVLKTRADTKAVREALAGNTGTGIMRDYRNKKVFSAFAPLDISYGVRWTLIVDMDRDEALAMEGSVKRQILYIAIILLLLWIVLVLMFHRRMAGKVLR